MLLPFLPHFFTLTSCFVLGTALLSVPAFAMDDRENSRLEAGSSQEVPRPSFSVSQFLEAGPILTPLPSEDPVSPDLVVAAAERVAISENPSDIEVWFHRARSHHIKSLHKLGLRSQEDGDYFQAFKWYILTLGCSFVADKDCRTILSYFQPLERLVKTAKAAWEKDKTKKKRTHQIKAYKQLIKGISNILNDERFSPPFSLELVKESYRLKLEVIEKIAVHLREDNYYKAHAFIGLSSPNREDLNFFRTALRFGRGFTKGQEALMYELELSYLEKMNSASAYGESAQDYETLGRGTASESRKRTSANKLLSAALCFQRAEELYPRAGARGLQNLAQLYRDGHIGQHLPQAAWLERFREICMRSFELDDDQEKKMSTLATLGEHFLLAGLQPEDERETEYFARAQELLERLPENHPGRLNLGMAYDKQGKYQDAKRVYLELGSVHGKSLAKHVYREYESVGAKSLINVGLLYLFDRLPEDITEAGQNYQLAKQYLEAALEQAPDLGGGLYNLGLLYAQGHVDMHLTEDERMTIALDLILRALKTPEGRSDTRMLRSASLYSLYFNNYDEAETFAMMAESAGVDVRDIFDSIASSRENSAMEESATVLVPIEGLSDPVILDSADGAAASVSSSSDEGEMPVLPSSVSVSTPTVEEEADIPEVGQVKDSVSSRERSATKVDKKMRKAQRDREKIMTLMACERFIETVESPPKWTFDNDQMVLESLGGQFQERLEHLFEDILIEPWGLAGIGKPEILKHLHKRYNITVYSRRIDDGIRLTYYLNPRDRVIHFVTWQGHYEGIEEALRLANVGRS